MTVNEHRVQYDLKVINAYKSYYGGINIINGLNMNVTSGSIYGLLGPSGCGKSTLLQCILGVLPLDSGTIESEIHDRCDIGYMPQDLCLDGKLTIRETFEYYGTIYKMKRTEIKNRINELQRILSLPDLNSYIEDISGGENRRVSLAITLLHDPKIMIMDEPTVGVDSTLRHEIWAEFTRMVEQQKKTIIITTHYIEEANQANCVGLMRNGILLEEGSPEDILLKYNSESLESAFLTICCNELEQEDNNVVCKSGITTTVECQTRWKKPMKSSSIFDYSRIKALLKKNTQLFSRDYMLMFTMLVFPIMQVLLICTCIGNDIKNLEIAIKNDETDFLSCRDYNNNECIFENNSNQTLSCVITNHLLSLGYILAEVSDRDAGESIMKNSNYIAFIYFPENYTSELVKYIESQEDYDLQLQPYINLNNYNALNKGAMLKNILDTMVQLLQDVLRDCSNNPRALDLPLRFISITGKKVLTYTNSIISIYVAMGAFYFPCLFSVSVMLTEKMDGILGRSMIAGVTKVDLIVSLFCISNALLVLQMVTPLYLAYVLFGNPVEITNGLFAFGLLIILLGWTGFSYGIIVAILSPSKMAGIFITNGLTYMQSMLAGGIWPISAQMPALQVISELLPIRIAGNTMTDISLKGWTSDNPSVVQRTLLMVLYNAVLFSVLVILGKFKSNLWLKR